MLLRNFLLVCIIDWQFAYANYQHSFFFGVITICNYPYLLGYSVLNVQKMAAEATTYEKTKFGLTDGASKSCLSAHMCSSLFTRGNSSTASVYL